MAQSPFAGEYHLQGMRETASAFRFDPDGTFQFYFSYGAVDRFAKGTYTVEGKTVKLKSSKTPGKDFVVTRQSKNEEGPLVKVNDPNKFLTMYVRCICVNGQERMDYDSDSQGEIRIGMPHCEKMYLLHVLFPDIVTLIKDADNDNNQFEVTLSPSLAELSFVGIDLTIEKEGELSMPINYFLPAENIRYVKH